MARVPIKFRCYRCNQLLGVSPAKAGSTVACPKCSADLVVPEPADLAPAPAASGLSSEAVPAVEAGGHFDPVVASLLSEINVEDIRVEPGVAILESTTALSPVSMPPPVAAPPSAQPATEWVPEPTQPQSLPESAGFAVVEPPPPVSPPAPQTPPVAPPVVPRVNPAESAQAEIVVPPIKLAERKIVEVDRGSAPRPRDVVIPRSVVLAWSLLVLAAVTFAFVAGLLCGHFVWRVHDRTARAERAVVQPVLLADAVGPCASAWPFAERLGCEFDRRLGL
jgi:DNA-directed RNA polymerase subunit RPC12/RpoP